MTDLLIEFLTEDNISRSQLYPFFKGIYKLCPLFKSVYILYPFFKVLQNKLYILRNNQMII